ncbi:molybdenum cofactor guanylyltransferase [Bacillus gobiensis]|uniref:molybdenum cofactor guanylyltransferase n=1 Tax=Bacillus gobiensis TaxID=1441095 RepID=UPI003D20B81C
MKHSHILLAGGKSSRFGQPKAFKNWNGMLLYEWCKQALGGEQTYIVSHPSLVARFQERMEENIIVDLEPFSGKGPLAGIYTAMNLIESDYYTFLPCDTPLVEQRTIELLKREARGFDAVVPIADGRIHPLVSVIHHQAKDIVYKQLLGNQLRAVDLFQLLHTNYLEVECFGSKSWEFINVNVEEDLKELNKHVVQRFNLNDEE